jgi:arylsulfatase A-like enzyme
LAGTADIAPTILERAGVAPFNGMTGLSLLPVVAGQTRSHRTALLIEEESQRVYTGFQSRARLRTLVGERFRLSVYEGFDWAELYDLRDDPLEMRNLWGDPAARAGERDMLECLCREMIAASETSPAPTGAA